MVLLMWDSDPLGAGSTYVHRVAGPLVLTSPVPWSQACLVLCGFPEFPVHSLQSPAASDLSSAYSTVEIVPCRIML